MAHKTHQHAPQGHRPLDRLDLSAKADPDSYDRFLRDLQTRFMVIQQAYLHTGNNAVIVFEGWDAAGKGGTIRRIASVMDPRGFKVWPIAAPTQQEQDHHYLTRFWQRLPGRGEIAVFDRSWYGRLLVERVEGFAKPSQWGRAFGEINEFERMLVDDGTRVMKVFLYITPDEQLKRFRDRMEDPLKRWKLSYEDFRNRERWDDYQDAANEMLERTSTSGAPWLVLPANDKKYARLEAMNAIADTLSDGVDLQPPKPDDKLRARFERLIKEEN
jgi:AMP-polyphosphate phosphotransferase